MYSELEKQAKKEYLALAKARYKDIVGESEEPPEEEKTPITAAWLALLLGGYDAVTKYVFTHEVDRKRARMAEAVIASKGKGMPELLRARDLWTKQVTQYSITVEDEAVVEAYRTLGVEKVQWIAKIDGRECEVCRERHKRVYKLDAVPAKPHYNCRCYIIPVESDL